MPYYTRKELEAIDFKYLGENIKISTKASIYNPEQIKLGDNSRVDDFCVLSGKITTGRNVYIAPFSLIAGGVKGIIIEDFSTFAYHVQIFTQSDDYSGKSMTNSTIPSVFKRESKKQIFIKKHSIVGAGSIIFPGVTLEEGTSIGAMSLVLKSTQPWGVYVGIPARRIKTRSQDLLQFEKEYLKG